MSAATVRLAFVGDIMLGRRIDRQLSTTAPEAFWGDLLPVLRAADAVVGNLECPITEYRRPWRRTPKAFRFRARPEAAAVLATANLRLVNLANNHILDYREQGLFDTVSCLQRAGIASAGAGANAYEAARPALVSLDGATVGLIGLTDNMPEWRAGHDTAGTNYVSIRSDGATLNLLRAMIREARWAGADIVVVSCHWGPNLRPFPPRRFRRFARHAVELGADVFHGHSAHLFQGVELHRGGLILYDTGDVLDDFWVFPGIRIDQSFVFEAEFADRRLSRLAMRPLVQARTSVGLAEGAAFEAICRRMERRSRALGTVLNRSPEGLELLPASDAPGVAREVPFAAGPASGGTLACLLGNAG